MESVTDQRTDRQTDGRMDQQSGLQSRVHATKEKACTTLAESASQTY